MIQRKRLKTILGACILSLAFLAACSQEEEVPSAAETDTVSVESTLSAGDGVSADIPENEEAEPELQPETDAGAGADAVFGCAGKRAGGLHIRRTAYPYEAGGYHVPE